MASQDQQEQKKKRKKRQRQGPVLLTVEPRAVYRGHLVWLIIAGEKFAQNTWRTLEVTEAQVMDQRFESNKRIALQVRVNPGEHNAILRVSFGSAETENPEGPLPPADSNKELTKNEVRVIASPIEGTAIVPDEKDSDGPPRLAFGIAEITNRQYLDFLNYIAINGDHSSCHPDESPEKSHVPDYWDDTLLRAPENPVTGLDWFDAYAYAAWKGYRLPTAKEWERAAGGTVYPWGDEPVASNANTKETATMLVPSAAHRGGVSASGLTHMAGNAGEWVDAEGRAAGTAVIKGGSFRGGLLDARVKEGSWADKLDRRIDVGFRIAVDLTDEIWAAKKAAEAEWLATMQGSVAEPAPAIDAENDEEVAEEPESSPESEKAKESPPESGEERKKKGRKQRNKRKKKK